MECRKLKTWLMDGMRVRRTHRGKEVQGKTKIKRRLARGRFYYGCKKHYYVEGGSVGDTEDSMVFCGWEGEVTTGVGGGNGALSLRGFGDQGWKIRVKKIKNKVYLKIWV